MRITYFCGEENCREEIEMTIDQMTEHWKSHREDNDEPAGN